MPDFKSSIRPGAGDEQILLVKFAGELWRWEAHMWVDTRSDTDVGEESDATGTILRSDPAGCLVRLVELLFDKVDNEA